MKVGDLVIVTGEENWEYHRDRVYRITIIEENYPVPGCRWCHIESVVNTFREPQIKDACSQELLRKI